MIWGAWLMKSYLGCLGGWSRVFAVQRTWCQVSVGVGEGGSHTVSRQHDACHSCSQSALNTFTAEKWCQWIVAWSLHSRCLWCMLYYPLSPLSYSTSCFLSRPFLLTFNPPSLWLPCSLSSLSLLLIVPLLYPFSPFPQAASLRQLEEENHEAATRLEEVVYRGDLLLEKIQGALADIAQSQLRTRSGGPCQPAPPESWPLAMKTKYIPTCDIWQLLISTHQGAPASKDTQILSIQENDSRVHCVDRNGWPFLDWEGLLHPHWDKRPNRIIKPYFFGELGHWKVVF